MFFTLLQTYLSHTHTQIHFLPLFCLSAPCTSRTSWSGVVYHLSHRNCTYVECVNTRPQCTRFRPLTDRSRPTGVSPESVTFVTPTRTQTIFSRRYHIVIALVVVRIMVVISRHSLPLESVATSAESLRSFRPSRPGTVAVVSIGRNVSHGRSTPLRYGTVAAYRVECVTVARRSYATVCASGSFRIPGLVIYIPEAFSWIHHHQRRHCAVFFVHPPALEFICMRVCVRVWAGQASSALRYLIPGVHKFWWINTHTHTHSRHHFLYALQPRGGKCTQLRPCENDSTQLGRSRFTGTPLATRREGEVSKIK